MRDFPRGLNENAQPIWIEIYDDISKRYEINNFEIPLLVRYCNCLHQIERWEKRDVLDNVMVTNPRGGVNMNPEYKAYSETMKTLMQIADRFGLTPKARTKLDASIKNGESESDDGFEDFNK